MTNQYIVCSIHTDSGKTVTTTLLYDYLKDKLQVSPKIIKPIQTGPIKDTEMYTKWKVPQEKIGNFYSFQTAASPHIACKLEQQAIHFDDLFAYSHALRLKEPALIFELAGGLYTPINDNQFMIDFIEALQIPVILVMNNYLGSINHSLLTIQALQQKKIPIQGFVYNHTDQDTKFSEEMCHIIQKTTKIPLIGEIPYITNLENQFTSENIRKKIYQAWCLP
ncbi:dethiobiotin synthase [Enterococcus lemanii]|jgi:dethiobiotin synthetase|uniref:ATP-dependent dethiobiotin synthetase BioD n=1 Tax=Enterococcus lemanii TaxID=1159752 RepID=A0ABV9MU59_9ENTE|nr:dethiobiotin synthase [Enterococcus lemanii]MBM7708469.1 dethiobiotin synthetase [Enterococcus lemanii]